MLAKSRVDLVVGKIPIIPKPRLLLWKSGAGLR